MNDGLDKIDRETYEEAADQRNTQFQEPSLYGWLDEPEKYVANDSQAATQTGDWATTKEQRLALQKHIYDLAQTFAPECGGYTNVPNWYWDRLQGLLPATYFGMAMYAWRRTIGRGKLIDRIANSQFMSGAMMHDGKDVRDYGCGLSRDTVTDGRNFLHEAGVMAQIKPNNAPKNDGPEIRIEIDPSKIDWEFLKRQKNLRALPRKKKTAKGIEARKNKSRERRELKATR